MSGDSVADVNLDDIRSHLGISFDYYDWDAELSFIHRDDNENLLVGVQDDGGDVRLWKVTLEEIT